MPALNRTPKDAVDPRALHERIATDLRREILTGERAPGTKLPSTQALKERFDASSATIQKAVAMLKVEGLAAGKAGSAVTVVTARSFHPVVKGTLDQGATRGTHLSKPPRPTQNSAILSHPSRSGTST